MPEFSFAEMFPLAKDETPYRRLSTDHVGVERFAGQDIVTVAPEALTLLTREAFHDISHLLRPAHLKQLASILDDPEASDNDRFVAVDLLRNANVAPGGVQIGRSPWRGRGVK